MPHPLGKREGLTLEFKSSASLRDRGAIAREVVSMLNSGSGGEVWIGVGEKDGEATEFQPIEGIDRAKDDLLNALLDRIDPAPRAELELKKAGPEANVLLIEVRAKPKKGGYSLKGKSHEFFTRVDHRVTAMTREEIQHALSGMEDDRTDEAASKNLELRRDSIRELHGSFFWMAIQPSPPGEMDLRLAELRSLLKDPTLAGNRRTGWSYGALIGEPKPEPKAKPTKRLALRDYKSRQVSIAEDGCVELQVPLQSIENHKRPGSREIHPLGLLEYVVSTVRLARRVHQTSGLRCERVLLDAALTGTSGWRIPQYAPDTFGYDVDRDVYLDRTVEDVLLAKPLVREVQELTERADELGFLLVREIYEFFDLREENIAPEYDRARGVLKLSE